MFDDHSCLDAIPHRRLLYCDPQRRYVPLSVVGAQELLSCMPVKLIRPLIRGRRTGVFVQTEPFLARPIPRNRVPLLVSLHVLNRLVLLKHDSLQLDDSSSQDVDVVLLQPVLLRQLLLTIILFDLMSAEQKQLPLTAALCSHFQLRSTFDCSSSGGTDCLVPGRIAFSDGVVFPALEVAFEEVALTLLVFEAEVPLLLRVATRTVQ